MSDKKDKDENKSREGREESRPARVPLAQQRVLAANAPKGYVCRWVNEVPGRVEKFLAAGYHVVLESGDISENRIQDASNLGSVQRRVVNTIPGATSNTAVLMAIKQEWYDEDQEAKVAENRKTQKALDAESKRQADYGEIKRS